MRNVIVLVACLFTASVSTAEFNGEYIARISGCVVCHTVEGGTAVVGGKKLPIPVRDICSTNTTPDKTQGIGNYSYEDFEKAVWQGIAKDGHPFYPAVPYPPYVKLLDEDAKALYSYFMHDVTPPAQPNKENAIPWLPSARRPLHIWNWLFTGASVVAAEGAKTDNNVALVKRGTYLVEGPGHCGSCHIPRGMAMNEKVYINTNAEHLSGAMIDGWYVPSLRGTGMSEQELKSLLPTGKSKHAVVSGPVAEAVTQNTQYLTDEDTTAIAQYLLSLKSRKPETVRAAATIASWSNSPEAGKMTYNCYCSTCHSLEGKGMDDNAPSLVNNPLVVIDSPISLSRVIACGAETPTTCGSVSLKMFAYGGLLSDNEIRDVINHARKSQGEGNGEVSQEDLAGIRKASH